MKSRNRMLTLVLLLMIGPLFLTGQQQDQAISIRNIQARKLAQHWQGKNVELLLTDGTIVKGEFVEASFYEFTLADEGGKTVIAIDEVESVAFKPGLMEAILTGAAG
ncbi:MAG: hypothetical protein KAU50_00160, partial [Candidatus Marinimicrobia bacterium]|nr:hypothetical protein [Candidatus Neomarinimicrobiota bacterium]